MGVCNFRNTWAMRVIFFFKMFKILCIFQKCNNSFSDNCIWSGSGKCSRCVFYIPLVTVSYFLKNHHQFIGNKAKERISKQWLQENKPRQISWKNKISYTLTHTYCAYQGMGSFSFSEIWLALVSCNHEIRSFDLLPTS